MKIFDIIKKIFKVEKVDDINEEMVDAYYSEMEKTEEKVEETTEEVVENAEPATETETVEETPVEETPEEVVENAEPVVEEQPTEEVKDEVKEDVLTKEVINSSKGNIPMSKADIMELHGDQFFTALYKNKKNLM